MKRVWSYCALLCGLFFAGCLENEENGDDRINLLKPETLPEVIDPADNPSSPSKIKLGKLLFFDPILSGERDVACATCHHPNHGYGDGLDLPIGVGGKGLSTNRIAGTDGRIPIVGRNAPTVINAAYNGLLSYHQQYNASKAPMFWDGRRTSLESQSLGPPTSFNEMRGDAYPEALTYDSIVARLKNIPEYVSLFSEAFGGGISSITEQNLGKAIASFERTIVSKNSPYDQYVRGNTMALNDKQKEGLLLFFNKANCSTCHSGPMFSDFSYYNLGIAENTKRDSPDKGQFNKFNFRTPTLRNVALTAPYMHNGTHETLEDVLDYYNEGKTENPEIGHINFKIKPLELSKDEVGSIIAFLTSLTDESYDKEVPARVPSGLKPGGN